MGLGQTIRDLSKSVFDNELIPGFEVTEVVTVSWEIEGTFNPDTGVVDDASIETEDFNAQIKEFGLKEEGLMGGTIKAGDLQVTFLYADDSHIPQTGDTITFNEKLYRIMSAKEKRVDGQPFSFTCVGRET